MALFVAVWLWISVRVLKFTPQTGSPKLEISGFQSSVAGLLATTVSTSTAALLGIEVQKIKTNTLSTFGAVSKVLSENTVQKYSCVFYVITGVVVSVTYFLNEAKAPGVMSAFSLTVFGWLAGAYAAALSK
jgi:hypothetical protein